MWVSDIFTRSTTIRFSHRERQSFEAFENLFESYRTIRYLALLSQYHGGSKKKGRKKERKKERKSLTHTRAFRRAPPFFFFFFFLTRMSSHSHSNEAIDSSRKREGRGCDQIGTISHKRNASTLVPIIHFYTLLGCIDPPLLLRLENHDIPLYTRFPSSRTSASPPSRGGRS